MPREKLRDMLITWGCLIFVFILIFATVFTPMATRHSTFTGSLDKTPLGHYNATDNLNSITGTRANNPYTSPAIYPDKAENSDGDNLDYLNLDEEVPGDSLYEKSGDSNEPSADWIEVSFPSAGIPVSSIINNITYYYGYYTSSGWGLTADALSNITSRVDATENNLGNYTLSSPADTDIDAIKIETANLPSAENLNSGNFIVRFRGVDGGAPPADNFYLDYCYFTINYSIPNIVINEVMFNPTGSDNSSEWIELYNAEAFQVDLTGWSLTDNDGNIFDLSGAGSIPAGGYLVCHPAQSGTNSTTDVHGAIINMITLQPSATEGMDNYLTDMNINSNYGDSSILDMENSLNDRRTIIQFNISSLPNGITDSHFWLYKYDGPSDNDLVANVHRVISPWTELGSDWDTYDDTNDWPINDDGGDYDPYIEDAVTILRDINGWYSWDITDLTRAWVNGTYQNYGMIFIADANSKLHRFRSSDYTSNTSMRPKQIVYYRDITIKKILEDNDDLALLNNDGNIIDYIAWGSDPGIDDNDAVRAGQWNDGDYINTSQIFEGRTLGRNMNSNDTDQPEDWQNSTSVADRYGVDRSDMYGPSPGEANVDPVSGVPFITGVSANPPTQYIGGYVNITCNVMDTDGIYGVWVNITLPGGGYVNGSMIQGPGYQWYNNNTYPILGIHQYTIWANNTNNNWSSSSVFGFIITIPKPILSNSNVSPVSGYIDSWFNFTVSYSHLLNKAPDIITLNLTGPSGGIFGLMEVDFADTYYTDGKLFYYNTSGLAMGSYSFHFAANDTDGNWIETGEIFLPSVANKMPSLSSSQVIPAMGYIDTGFNFTVTYTDLDNHAPSSITVNITGMGIYDLIEVDPLDVDYADGKLYYFNISGIPIGTVYTFHFAANDTIGDWIEGFEVDGPDVINRDPILSLGQVQPTTGYNETWFNFTVTYTDLDGHAPDKITVNITGFGILDMIEIDPSDMDYTDGKFYYLNISGFQNDTSYSFHFAANDLIGDWTETAEILGLLVLNTPPALFSPGINPLSGPDATYFNFTVTYYDIDNHPPDDITLNLTGPSGGTFDLVEADPSDNDYSDGKAYYYNTTLSNGTYSFHFAADDSLGFWYETTEINAPLVGVSKPILTDSGVAPVSGDMDTWFNFTVNYYHPFNIGPAYTKLNLTGPSGGIFDLVEVDPSDTDYTDGKLFYYNVSGLAIGSYSFHFAANDTDGNWSETGEMFLPSVVNRIPSLSASQVSPAIGYIDTGFNFTATYTDLDNHAPSTITVNITGMGIYDLMEVDGSDVDYTDGKPYYINISGIPLGTTYTFHFASNDTIGDWTETAELPGPQVLNSLPTLLFHDVAPLSGSSTTYFKFTVTYMDIDNHPPDSITLNLTGPSGGVLDLVEVDISDMDYTDGKLYYYNVSGLTVGSYSFHFSANDSMGDWAIETPESNAPDVLLRSAALTALDETVEYSDNIFLIATLMEDGTPIAGEAVAFYIDVNDNGIYEPWELVGSGTTLADGIVSVIYTTYLAPDTYDFTAIYIGSGGFDVEDSFALININPKPATLTAQSRLAEEEDDISLNATLFDKDGNPVASENVDVYVDKNKNTIYEGGELVGSEITSASGIASFGYSVNLAPGNYDMWARYVGSDNYSVTEIEGILVVQNTTNTPPAILGIVPDQIKSEDSQPWTLDLTTYEADIENTGPDLKWFLTGVDTSLYSVTGYNSSNDVFTFILKENAFGNDEVTMWLVDRSGDWDSQVMWINITPVNDLPYFDPKPPDIFVHYNDPGTADDDPSPWDYTFYVHDIETPKEGLAILTSEPTEDSGDGYAEVTGLNVTFHYPQSRVGDSILVTLTLYDGFDSTQTVIMVNVTSDWVPELVSTLPDITIEENSTNYNVFDLDDYFIDRDHDSLFFSSGYQHLTVVINSDNTVDITAAGEWTGSELVTFRAKDPTGAIVEDTITVTVIPVNDGPVISGAPDLNVHYDYSYGFDFTPYIEDSDNSHSELSLWTSELTDNIWIQEYNNLGIVVNYPESMNGMTFPVTIFVSDGVSTASQEIQVTISDNFPPELMYSLPDVSFHEDTVFEDAILLSYYFLDIDGDALFFSNGSTFINVVINNDLTVDFSAPENWYGFEAVTFRATDPTGSIAEDTILIVVVPVNDAPTIDSIPGQEKNEGDQWVLDLSQYIDDVDNDASELIITVESEAGQGYVTLTGDILVFQYPEGINTDIVTITVNDGELETQRSFTVTLQSQTPVAPSIWNLIPWHWILLMFFVALGGAFALYKNRSKYIVHEAFLVHEKGLPIAHASRQEGSELEDVVVSGMFTAVQDFISDAFSGKTQDDEWKLDEMKFGENKILIERSEDLYLAAIFEGNGERLGSRLRNLLKDIDEKYSDVFTDWDGDMTELAGISAVITALVSKKAHKNTGSEESQTEIPSEVDSEEPGDAHVEGEDIGGLDNEEQETIEKGDEKTPSEETVVYECPECESEIRSTDIRCPVCGVEFSEINDLDSTLIEEDNEIENVKDKEKDEGE